MADTEEKKTTTTSPDEGVEQKDPFLKDPNKKKRKKKNNKKKKGARERELLALLRQRVSEDEVITMMKNELGDQYDKQLKAAHGFWDHQPVLPLDAQVELEDNCPIDRIKTVDEISKDPLPLPAAYEWCEIDIEDENALQEVYELLRDNYVEDDDNLFRFDYSKEFLKWAMQPPGYKSSWHICVRAKDSQRLFGFITAIPALIRVYEKKIPMVEINFLCVHKKLRAKRLAPVLIKEITRRVNVTDTWQAVYTAGRVLPKPMASCQYFHRTLNPVKLVAIKFTHLPPRQSMAMMKRLYALPKEPETPGFRPMTKRDVGAVTQLLRTYLAKFHLAPILDEQEVAHWCLPRDDVIYSYVVEDPETKQVTDFGSFYKLPSTVIGNARYSTLNAAYSYYNVATKTPLVDLMKDILIMAKQCDFDVFNALNVMDNSEFLEPLRFGAGDGHLQFYLYNWKCAPTTPPNVGLVLL
mmetsp:Transcript_37829/g.95078  ORF Transcript_37829/g.95078 Transcript_37829/m.95078 type:complete len:467 (+) Transcript_37829:53-1453(+)|eukprot:CAMPEP_0177659036 /NCGR_PEP_ID=MMETSP0447-20121125/17209_1 /TAXON_ID=0 /ORGANISM="Stygamoeba regulata, Strain BSH-02190019" /LENGTH=466 /DNA_ID=CAMNT_0019163841 /DNA_START=32 /DNA_END=1432 /DNA_ORIENTATION=+